MTDSNSFQLSERVNVGNANMIVRFQKSIFKGNHACLLKPCLKYIKGSLDNTGNTKVTYQRQEKCSKCPLSHGGRFVAATQGTKYWLGGIQGAIRATLHEGVSWDYDIQCCHPTMLSQYCKKRNIKTPNLDYYIRNYGHLKEKYYGCKYAVIGFMNGGGFHKFPKLKSLDLFVKLHKEITSVYKDIIDGIPEWKDHLASLKKKQRHGRFRHLSSIYTQNLESQALAAFHKACSKIGVEVATLIHDGCLVYSQLTDTQLMELSNLIYQDTGYRFEIVHKDHSSEVIDFTDMVEELVADSEKDAARLVIERYLNSIYVHTPTGLYVEENGVWVSGSDKELRLLFDTPQIYKRGRNDELVQYSYSVSHAIKILKAVRALTPVDPDFIETVNQKTKYEIHFEDGWYWDVRAREFKERTFIPLARINRNAPVDKFKQYLEHKSRTGQYHPEVQEAFDVFNAPFDGDTGHYLLKGLARGAAGCRDKVYAIMLGPRHSGKSGIQKLTRDALGEQYCTTGFIPIAKRSSGDEAQNNRWVLTTSQNKARINFTNELRKPDGAGKAPVLDGKV